MTSITYAVGWSSPPTVGDDVTDLTVTLPGAAGANPALVVIRFQDQNTGTIVAPTGWTQRHSQNSDVYVYTKDVGSSEADPQWTWDNAMNVTGVAVRFTAGVADWATTLPSFSTGVNDHDPDAVTISPTGAAGVALAWTGNTDARRTSSGGPTGYTNYSDQNNGSVGDVFAAIAFLDINANGHTSEDPGDFQGIVGPSGIWQAFTAFVYEEVSDDKSGSVTVSGTSSVTPTGEKGAEAAVTVSGTSDVSVTGKPPYPYIWPSTNVSAEWGGSFVGPIQDTNGNLYVVVEEAVLTPDAQLWKSTDGGVSYSMVAQEVNELRDLEAAWIVKVPGRTGEWMLLIQRSSGSDVRTQRFGDSTHATFADDFDAVGNVYAFDGTSGANPDEGDFGNSVSAAQWNSTQLIMAAEVGVGSASDGIIANEWAPGSNTWGTSFNVAVDAGTTNYTGAHVVAAASDGCWIVYKDHTNHDIYAKSYSSAGVLGSPVQVNTGSKTVKNAISSPVAGVVYYDDGGDEVIQVVWLDNSDILWMNEIRNGVAGTTPVQVSTKTVPSDVVADATNESAAATVVVDAAAKTVYVPFASTPDNEEMFVASSVDGAAFSSPESMFTSQDVHSQLSAEIIDIGGDPYIGVVYITGTEVLTEDNDIAFNVYALATDAKSGSVTVSGASSVTADGEKGAEAAVTVSGVSSVTPTGEKGAEGAVSVSGVSAVTPTGEKGAEGSASMSGAGAVTPTGEKGAEAAVTVSGASSVTADGEKGAEGAVTVSGAGAVTPTASTDRAGSVTVSGAGAVTPTGEKGAEGAVTVSGVEGVTANGEKGGEGAVTVSGVSDVSVTGDTAEPHSGSVTVSGASSVTPAGEKGGEGSASMSGVSGVSVDVAKAAAAAATVSGVGGVTADGETQRFDSVTVSGVSDVSVTGDTAEPHSGSVTVSGVGGVTADGEKGAEGSASMSGASSVTADGEKGGEGAVTVSGVESVTPIGETQRSDSVTVSGTPSVTPTGEKGAEGSASMSGASGVSVTGAADEAHAGSVTVSGAGAVTPTGKKGAEGSASMSGASGVSVTGAADEAHAGSVTVSGAGAVTPTGKKGAQAVSTVSGVGGVTADGEKGAEAAVTVSGTSDVSVTGSKLEGQHRSGSVTVIASASVTPTGKKGAQAVSTVSGSGSVVPVGLKASDGSTTLSGASGVVSDGDKGGEGSVSIGAGGAGVSTTGDKGGAGLVTLPVVGLVTLSAESARSASVSIGSSATVTPIGDTQRFDTVTVSASVSVTADGEPGRAPGETVLYAVDPGDSVLLYVAAGNTPGRSAAVDKVQS